MVEESPIKPVVSTRTLKAAVKDLFNLILEQEACTMVNELGKLLKWGELDDPELEDNPTEEYNIIDAPGVDIFGQPLFKKPNFECECPKCKRTLAAARFAPHLEKCMGMGRNSSRIASRRLAASSHSNNNSHSNSSSSVDTPSNSKSSTISNPTVSGTGSSGSHVNGDIISEDEHFEEDEDDEEWTMEKKKKTKKNTEKTTPKKKWAISRVKNSGKRSGPPSFNNSPASAFSDQGNDDVLDDPLGIIH